MVNELYYCSNKIFVLHRYLHKQSNLQYILNNSHN